METEKVELIKGKVDWRGRAAMKHQHGGMRAALLVLTTFGFENMATLALAVNLVIYFNGVMHFTIAEAATELTNYMGVSYILSILFAFLADTYIARFKTVVISASFEFLGLALLTVQAHYPSLKPRSCNMFDPTASCEKAKGSNAALLFLALYMLAIGSAGLKASLPPHGADQFEDEDSREARQMSSYFNCLLLALCVGGSISLTFIVWIQDNKGWDWGFGISTVAILMGIVVFAAGLPMYRVYVIRGDSAFLEIIQVYVAAFRNRRLKVPEDATELYEINHDQEAAIQAEFLPHRHVLRCLDKAAIQTSTDAQQAPSRWKLCRVTQVENAKIILGMLPVFCCTIIMTLCLAQLQTFSIQQGFTMDTSMGSSFHIPPASLPILPVTFLIILIPLYDQLIVPLLRKFTGHPTGITHLQRIGVGLILSSISMGVAAVVEVKRKGVARDHDMLDANPAIQPLPISVFWLSLQYFIFGIADMFTYVGLLEFFYSEAPKALKSMSTSFLWCSMAFGYFFSSILVNLVNSATEGMARSGGWLGGNNINRNHLNLFYWLLSVLSFINFIIYLFVAKRYKYRPQPQPVHKEEESADRSVCPADHRQEIIQIAATTTSTSS